MIEGVGRVSPGSLAWGHSYSVAVRRSILRIAAASPAESRTHPRTENRRAMRRMGTSSIGSRNQGKVPQYRKLPGLTECFPPVLPELSSEEWPGL